MKNDKKSFIYLIIIIIGYILIGLGMEHDDNIALLITGWLLVVLFSYIAISDNIKK